MELLVVIAGIVLLWKFGSMLSQLAHAGEAKSELFYEEVMMDIAEQRAENVKEFTKIMENQEVKSHKEIMALLKVKK